MILRRRACLVRVYPTRGMLLGSLSVKFDVQSEEDNFAVRYCKGAKPTYMSDLHFEN